MDIFFDIMKLIKREEEELKKGFELSPIHERIKYYYLVSLKEKIVDIYDAKVAKMLKEVEEITSK